VFSDGPTAEATISADALDHEKSLDEKSLSAPQTEDPGLALPAVFVPVMPPHDVDNVAPDESLLVSKPLS